MKGTKRKLKCQNVIPKFFRTIRPRYARSSLRRVVKGRRAPLRARRNRFSSRRRSSGYRSRPGRVSTVNKLTALLAPKNNYSFQLAGRCLVPDASVLNKPARYYCPTRRTVTNGPFSMAYPNVFDSLQIAYLLNRSSLESNLTAGISIVATANNYYTNVTSAPDSKFYLSNFSQSTQAVNQNNGQAVVTCYTCQFRKDVPYIDAVDSTLDILDILGNGFFTSNATEFTPGITESSVGRTSDNYYMTKDVSSPFQSSVFTRWVKIVKVKKVVLNAGDMHTFNMSNRRIITDTSTNYKRFLGTGDTTVGDYNQICAYRRGSMFQLFKVTGQLSNDPAPNQTSLNGTSPAVNFLTTCRFNYQQLVQHGKVSVHAENFGLTNLLNPQIITEGTDLPTSSVNA